MPKAAFSRNRTTGENARVRARTGPADQRSWPHCGAFAFCRVVCLWTVVALVVGRDVPAADEPADDEPQPRFAAMPNNEAWQRLPLQAPELPAWATILARPLPKSTGALLMLDSHHRTSNPIGNTLAAQLRWIAADAMGCDYARACSASDLLRNGQPLEAIQALRQDHARWTPMERATFQFAEQLTVAAYQVTDDEVAVLREHYGPEVLVGIVHTVAFANFENRLFLALGLSAEEEAAVPPVEWRIDLEHGQAAAPPGRPSHDDLLSADAAADVSVSNDWNLQPLTLLNERQKLQHQRPGRVPIPDDAALSELTPEQRQRSGRIVWSRVSLGYQRALTQGWFRLMDAFREESQLDRVFANTMFWVVTRSNECFY